MYEIKICIYINFIEYIFISERTQIIYHEVVYNYVDIIFYGTRVTLLFFSQCGTESYEVNKK